jgi:6-phosphogluconolactonase (cycloisomerase 2 family)
VGTPTTAAAGTTDSVTTPDGRFLYVGCTAAGEVLAFRVQSDGSLTLIQTVTGLPTAPAVAGPGAFEGIALN